MFGKHLKQIQDGATFSTFVCQDLMTMTVVMDLMAILIAMVLDIDDFQCRLGGIREI